MYHICERLQSAQLKVTIEHQKKFKKSLTTYKFLQPFVEHSPFVSSREILRKTKAQKLCSVADLRDLS